MERNYQNWNNSWARESFSHNIKNFLTSKNVLNRLITINIGVYLSFIICRLAVRLIGFLFQFDGKLIMDVISNYLACPASFTQLLRQPWSIVTSLFMHNSFSHIFFNMLMLFVIGRIFLQYIDEKHLLLTYLIGGIFGNLIYMTAYNIFPVFSDSITRSFAVGASGSIMAIMAAITIYKPNYEILLLLLGRIRLKYLTLTFIVIDLLTIPVGNAGGHIAHLGGFLFGAIYVLLFLNKKFSFNTFKTQKTKKKSKFYVSKESGRPLSDEEYNAKKHAEKLKLDEILDKISKYGYDALNSEEKEFLFHYSNK